MADIVGLSWYTPASWRRLGAAVEAAGLPRGERLPSHAEFVIRFDRDARDLERRDVMSKRIPIDVERMLEWCAERRLKPDGAARKMFIRSTYGDSPLRRIFKARKRCERDGIDHRDLRRAGVLACWQPINGAAPFDSRWDRWSAVDKPRAVNWLDARQSAEATEELPIEEWSGRQLLEWERPRRRRLGD